MTLIKDIGQEKPDGYITITIKTKLKDGSIKLNKYFKPAGGGRGRKVGSKNRTPNVKKEIIELIKTMDDNAFNTFINKMKANINETSTV